MGELASREENIHVTVEPVVDEPKAEVTSVSGQEDMWSKVHYQITPGDTDGSEKIMFARFKAFDPNVSEEGLRFSVFRDDVRTELTSDSDGFVTVVHSDLSNLEVAAHGNRHGTWDIETEVMIHDTGIEKVRIGPKFSVAVEPIVDDCASHVFYEYDPTGQFVILKGGVQSQDDDESVSYVMDLPKGVRLGYRSENGFSSLHPDAGGGPVEIPSGWGLSGLQLRVDGDFPPGPVRWKAYSSEGDRGNLCR